MVKNLIFCKCLAVPRRNSAVPNHHLSLHMCVSGRDQLIGDGSLKIIQQVCSIVSFSYPIVMALRKQNIHWFIGLVNESLFIF